MISFYILAKKLILKHKGLPDANVVSINKKEYGFEAKFFVKIHKVFKSNN